MRARLPNALSISRIALAIAVLVISGQLTIATYTATVCMVLVAVATDVVDGWLARRWHVASVLGYVLDGMGDRAIHLALVLTFFVRYEFHPVLIWLLIFRDIAIYAIRILSVDWVQASLPVRWISRFHATFIRLWLGLFLLRDGIRVFTGSDRLHSASFESCQLTLLCATIIVSYMGCFAALAC